jgi:hypothetical protein
MAKMIDMKRTAAEKKARDKEFDHKIGGEDYPYGLGVSLGHDELTKLGIHTLPTVGSKIMLHAHAHVKSASESSRDGGRKERRVELELRHMNVEGAKAGKPKPDTSEEGMRRGAKAAMDKVLPATKTSNKDLGSESAGDAEND